MRLVPTKGNDNYSKEFRTSNKKVLSKYDSRKPVLGLIGINLAVFAAWRYGHKFNKKIETFMLQNFTVSWNHLRHKKFHTILTSCFSHVDYWHLGLNMIVLWGWSPNVIHAVGWPKFFALYIGSGLVSTVCGAWRHHLLGMSQKMTVGASGCLYGALAACCMLDPNRTAYFLLLPFIEFKLMYGLGALVAADVVGLFFRKSIFDHAAHVGGFLFGGAYWYYLLSDKKEANCLGTKAINPETLWTGKIENYMAVGTGLVRSPTWTFYGQLSEDEHCEGHGQLKSETKGWVWEGEFAKGEMTGIGLLKRVDSKGKIGVMRAGYDSKEGAFLEQKEYLDLMAKREAN